MPAYPIFVINPPADRSDRRVIVCLHGWIIQWHVPVAVSDATGEPHGPVVSVNMLLVGFHRVRRSSGEFEAPRQISTGFPLNSLLHRRRATEGNQTARYLAVSWAGTLCTFWESWPLMEFCTVQNSLCVQVLCSPILAALLHDTRAVGVSKTLRLATRKGITELSLLICDLYSAGRPSRCASAHILVIIIVDSL